VTEHAEPGGVSCATRTPSAGRMSTSSTKPRMAPGTSPIVLPRRVCSATVPSAAGRPRCDVGGLAVSDRVECFGEGGGWCRRTGSRAGRVRWLRAGSAVRDGRRRAAPAGAPREPNVSADGLSFVVSCPGAGQDGGRRVPRWCGASACSPVPHPTSSTRPQSIPLRARRTNAGCGRPMSHGGGVLAYTAFQSGGCVVIAILCPAGVPIADPSHNPRDHAGAPSVSGPRPDSVQGSALRSRRWAGRCRHRTGVPHQSGRVATRMEAWVAGPRNAGTARR
jgi:hypothetical protein